MLLAEELALVAVNPETGRYQMGTRDQLNASLAGLLVAELVIADMAQVVKKDDIQLTGTGTAGAATLAAAAQVVEEKAPRLRAILSHMDRGLQRRLGTGTLDTALAGLVAAGYLAPATGEGRARSELTAPAVRDEVVGRLRAAAQADGPMDIRTAALLSLTGPAYLLEVVAPDRGTRRHARKRIDRALDATVLAPVAKTVRRVLADAAAAASAATTGGAIAASSG